MAYDQFLLSGGQTVEDVVNRARDAEARVAQLEREAEVLRAVIADCRECKIDRRLQKKQSDDR